MPAKRDMDSTTGGKLLRLFLRLMADRNRHFQTELAVWLNCSKQTIMRLMREIEGVVGDRLKTDLEDRRRWYQLCPDSRMPLGLDCEELRFLQICRDLACSYLPSQVQRRVDDSLFRLAMQLADTSATLHDTLDAAGFQRVCDIPSYTPAACIAARISQVNGIAHYRLLIAALSRFFDQQDPRAFATVVTECRLTISGSQTPGIFSRCRPADTQIHKTRLCRGRLHQI